MDNLFSSFDLTNFPTVDKEKRKDKIIKATKAFNKMIKDSRSQAKQSTCYYCKKDCDSFCNSHTLPAFCLRNIAQNGKVFYSNTILALPLLKDNKGVNEAGTFHLICRDCDSKIFQDYENPDNYEDIPSIKMLAQIDMKNNLKNISKRLMEIEMYDIMRKRIGVRKELSQAKKDVSDLDLNEFKAAYVRAKKRSLKPFSGDYHIGYYTKLPYVVPVAFQGTIALIFDLEGNVVNNVYNPDPKYKVMNMSLCIFPLKNTSIVMIFVAKDNNRYRQFFKQLKKLNSLDDQLNVINYILFSYSEDYFLSATLPQNVLKELGALSAKTPDLLPLTPPSIEERLEAAKEIFDFRGRQKELGALSAKTPNLLALTPPSIEERLETAKEIFNFRGRQNIPNLLSNQFALEPSLH